ncbi:hypothetical protein [Rhizobium rhizosphaerae]|uniref:hypothetical protein n=1 Tax=Xaviernesmea rhizosphaerae TaxID=1672749 RepID=UPI001FD9827A|nr:hypothetical protein [Xaviernesmea rhizosphaerae]
MLLGILAGCQTAEEYDAKINAEIDDRLNAYNGATMAEFQARTGMLPDDAYPIDGGRVFVFRTSPVFMTLPATNVTPAVTRSVHCQLLVQTVLADRRGMANSWKIVGTQRSGACRNLPV